jgi:predicted transcriptional regulator
MSSGFSGTEMKSARKQKSITLVELANQMGVSQGYLVRLEKGTETGDSHRKGDRHSG